MIPISRTQAEGAVPPTDCSGRQYTPDEREDLIRYVLLGAEMQRGDIVIKPIEVASIQAKNYKEVIEIRVPARFYWNEDDSFDGMEFGEFKTTLQPWEEDMVGRCLDAIKGSIE